MDCGLAMLTPLNPKVGFTVSRHFTDVRQEDSFDLDSHYYFIRTYELHIDGDSTRCGKSNLLVIDVGNINILARSNRRYKSRWCSV